MGKYIVTSGQNIYDVALHIYGSIEGIVDLMMNNTDLSLCDILSAGQELTFTDDFVINSDIVSYYRMNNVTPSNGERSVYYKTSGFAKLIEIYLDKTITVTAFEVSGNGTMEIDWGDNSEMHSVDLDGSLQSFNHFFDNNIGTDRKISIYGEVRINFINLTSLTPKSIYFLRPVYIEKFLFSECETSIDFIYLLEGVYKIELRGLKTSDLLPLTNCKHLKELNLSGAIFNQNVVDLYLITLVKEYYGRRNCHISLTSRPSGVYQEPLRDSDSNYIIETGMEAIWVITHEPAWNEAGDWVFDICGEVYSTPNYP